MVFLVAVAVVLVAVLAQAGAGSRTTVAVSGATGVLGRYIVRCMDTGGRGSGGGPGVCDVWRGLRHGEHFEEAQEEGVRVFAVNVDTLARPRQHQHHDHQHLRFPVPASFFCDSVGSRTDSTDGASHSHHYSLVNCMGVCLDGNTDEAARQVCSSFPSLLRPPYASLTSPLRLSFSLHFFACTFCPLSPTPYILHWSH